MKTGNHTHLLTIDRRIDMLTIVDLHQEEELSSSDMRKVAGGEEPIPGGGNGSRSEGTTGDGPDLGSDPVLLAAYGLVGGGAAGLYALAVAAVAIID
jgi:hypothetical protein